MSDLTWKDLRDLDCGGLADLGRSWRSYVKTASEHTQTLRAKVIDGHLCETNFESDTATRVREQIAMTADRFEDDLNDYASIRIATTLAEVSGALEAEQTDLGELAGLIESQRFEIIGEPRRYRVEPTGGLRGDIENLSPPRWLSDRTGLGAAAGGETPPAANRQITELMVAVEEVAGQYTDWLRAIMSRAHDALEDAAATLKAMRDEPAELPPMLGATYDELVDEYKDGLSEEVAGEMEAIAGGESSLSPGQVNEWWQSLSDTERAALVSEHPEWIGPADGIPVETRNEANRTVLDGDIAGIENRLAEMEANGSDTVTTRYGSAPSEEYVQLRRDLQELTDLRGRIEEPYSETGQEYFLLDFDTEGSGQAVVSIGNPDTADNVNVYVPGTGGGLDSASGGLMARAETMAADAAERSDQESATVLWMGYDAPDNVVPEAADTVWAEQASSDLESFTQGVRATAEGDASNLTLTGHSYGSTVIGTAASGDGVDADNVIFIGSPGVGVDTASALGVEEESVYATRNERDVIRYGMVHGRDPVSETFGGNVIHSDAVGIDPMRNHSTYWDDENMAGRKGMAGIVTGQAGGER